MHTIVSMYATLLPIIFTGCINMYFCKTKILQVLNKPIDNGIVLKDNRRLFGNNKTWKGFIGYILFTTLVSILIGIIFNLLNINQYNFFYINYSNTLLYNILTGFLLGLAYALFELPNSFIKRRIGIESGAKSTGISKYMFIIIDQIDSVIGCILVINIFYRMSFSFILFYIFLGGITHLAINLLLYIFKIRKTLC